MEIDFLYASSMDSDAKQSMPCNERPSIFCLSAVALDSSFLAQGKRNH